MVRALGHLAATHLPEFLPRQRWFGSKGRSLSAVSLLDCGPVGGTLPGPWLTLVEAAFAAGPPERYTIPLVVRSGEMEGGRLVGRLETAPVPLWAYEAFDDSEACLKLLAAFERSETIETERGRASFTRTGMFPSLRPRESRSARRVTSEQSNTSVIYDETLILKAFRKIATGVNPDCEVSAFLTTRTQFRRIPLLAGTLEYSGSGSLEATLGMLQHFVANQGDGWTYVLDHLKRFYAFIGSRGSRPLPKDPDPEQSSRLVREFSAGLIIALRRLGAVTGGLHAALASVSGDPAFAPEPVSDEDVARWTADIAAQVPLTLAALRGHLGSLADPARGRARAVLDRAADLAERTRDLAVLAREGCVKTRLHGDYHLGQTLKTAEDFVILDFEGEPARSLAERRAKHCPLKDVAGMLRSFDYAVAAASSGLGGGDPAAAQGCDPSETWGATWAKLAGEAFLEGYRAEAARAPVPLFPASPAALERVLGAYQLDKVLYELRYEINNRPSWVPIPLRGLTRLLGRGA